MTSTLVQVLKEDGALASKADPGLGKDELLRIYRFMSLLRLLDVRMLNLQRQGRIGFYGPTTGQEAATIASACALGKDDWILPALREAGAALVRGMPLTNLVAQCIGNAADVCKGRQMPCHYSFKEGHYVSMSSVIGTQLSHAAGVAMAMKYRKAKAATIGYLGDGATSSNDFHAAMNFAGVYQIPVVFFCQNNGWAISVPSEMQSASETFAQKAQAYGIPWVRVDGNDALAVYRVTKEALDKARKGGGPTFIEAVTYRRLGHSSSDDPSKYRDEKIAKAWEKKDPIDRLRRYLEAKKLWDRESEKEMLDELNAEISLAIQEAESASPPPVDSLFEDVYAQIPPHLQAQRKELP